MAIQNDNTLVTKGDLKELYTDKIAPYLGGGINYYHTDRSGQELKSAQYALALDPNSNPDPGTNKEISANTIVPFLKQSGNFEDGSTTGTFKVPDGMRIEVSVFGTANNGTSTNGRMILWNVTDNIAIDDANSRKLPSAYFYAGQGTAYGMSQSGVFQWTNNTGKTIDVGLYTDSSMSVRVASTGMTVKEIGRIVDPIQYTANNDELEETPVGNIISYMGNSVPKHHLACDGTEYAIGTYPELEAHIIKEFGSINYFGGNGTTTWAVPNLNGEFLRGTGTNGHAASGDGANVGIHQSATGINPGWVNNQAGGFSLPVAPSSDYSALVVDAGDKYVNTGKRKSIASSTDLKEVANTTDDGGYWTVRPTNTSVKFCIKYESTYHVIVPSHMYKVSIAGSISTGSGDAQYTFNQSDIIGDASLVSGNSFVAPVDGFYIVGMDVTNKGSTSTYTFIKVNGVDREFVTSSGSTHSLYLNKGDVITIWQHGNTASHINSGRLSFCLLTANYKDNIIAGGEVYSEEEQVIGTWKDGKPLYRKSFEFSNMTLNGTQQNFGNISNMNIEYGEVIESALNENGYWTNPGILCVWVRIPANNFGAVCTDGGTRSGTLYFTIQYTKTTDTAGTYKYKNSLLLTRPDMWEPNTEYDFGGGLYGQRFTGTIDVQPNMVTKVLASTGFDNASFVQYGGHLKRSIISGSYSFAIPTAYYETGNVISCTLSISGGQLQMHEKDNATQNGVPYDVWVTYKK